MKFDSFLEMLLDSASEELAKLKYGENFNQWQFNDTMEALLSDIINNSKQRVKQRINVNEEKTIEVNTVCKNCRNWVRVDWVTDGWGECESQKHFKKTGEICTSTYNTCEYFERWAVHE